jgi:FkbM family methyltransferase
MKQIVRKLLEQFEIYESVKTSVLYDFYARIFLRKYWNKLQNEVTLFRALIRKPGMIFDVGANGGGKANIYRRIATKVVCVEPDKYCIEVLHRKFRFSKHVEIVAAAVGESEGEGILYEESPGSCVNTLAPKWKSDLEQNKPHWWKAESPITFTNSYNVNILTLDRLIDLYGMPEYIKLDVEGFELQALRGLSHPVKLLSLEANLPTFLDETVECIATIARLSNLYKFAYSLEEGFGGELSPWLTHEQIKKMVLNSGFGFLEILAYSGSLDLSPNNSLTKSKSK